MPSTVPFRALALATGAALLLVGCDGAGAPAASKDAPAKSAVAAKDWTKTVVQTPEGGFRMGNPDASVKLVEFASFTCTHCRDFNQTAETALKPTYVKSGQVSYEYRPFMLNIYDFTAAKLAMCEGPERFFTWASALYGDHDAWVQPFATLTDADIAPLKSLAPDQQLRGLAEAGKLHEFARVRGLPKAKFDACMSDPKTLEKLTAMQQAAVDTYQISGTPSFVLNGKKLEGVNSWEQLQPVLADALG